LNGEEILTHNIITVAAQQDISHIYLLVYFYPCGYEQDQYYNVK